MFAMSSVFIIDFEQLAVYSHDQSSKQNLLKVAIKNLEFRLNLVQSQQGTRSCSLL